LAKDQRLTKLGNKSLEVSIVTYLTALMPHAANPSNINIVGDMMISRDEVKRLGLSPDSLKITDPKTGKVGYRAAIEVFHQLHCLNLLRQFTWKEYYVNDGGDISAEPEDVRSHVGRCNTV
jgi:hypothetical protein